MADNEGLFRPSSLELKGQDMSILKSGMQNVHFKNWSETFECFPDLFFAPKSVEEISSILKLAQDTKKKVRVVGCKHSPSDLAFTNDILVSLQNFNKILNIDKNRKQVKVQGGMVLSSLNDELYCHNLAFSVLGSISDITVAGAICVGTHGTGIKFGSLSSYVVEMDLMLYDGTISTVSADRNEDLFLSAVCSLGSLGVILNVTFQCEPAYNLHLRQYGLNLKDVIENLDVHLKGSEHFKFLWFPHTDGTVVSHCSRTEMPVPKFSWAQKMWRWVWEYGIGYYSLEFCIYISTFFPEFGPFLNRFYYNLVYSSSTSKIDRSYKVFNYDCLFKQYVNEWSIPIEKTGVVLWQLREWIESSGTYIHFPLEVRFVKSDNIFISPAYGRDSCYINIIMYRPYGKNVPCAEYWSIYEKIMLEAGGRPHWAKAHTVKEETFKHMYPMFGKWCAMRQKLDPINMFFNPYMARIFSNSRTDYS
ncbi:L-gulonolactone oxidase-like [Uloborus diversus]|uniref:L-gulonolactone oxidase-like n=1 Tax=Uloborus diversus TaxID=327109 RepID=UPI0024094D2F|nr:L-gulonolactone oxidase-like [Uloborus diversus]